MNFTYLLISMMSNTAIGRKTHGPNRHRWKSLPWLCLLRQRHQLIQAIAGATVKWQLEWHCINSRSVGRVIWSHGISYNCSMLEYKVIKLHLDFYDVQNWYMQEDKRTWYSLMETVILILPLEATTVNNPSNSRSDSGVIARMTVEQQQEHWQSKMESRNQLRLLNAII